MYLEGARDEVIAKAYEWHEVTANDQRVTSGRGAEHRLRAALERHQVALRASAPTERPPPSR